MHSSRTLNANHALNQFSCLDHFLASSNLYEEVTACEVNTNPLNPSDHRDIFIKFQQNIGKQSVKKTHFPQNKVAWYKVTDEHINRYQAYMDMLLDKIDFSSVSGAVTCCDVFCDDWGVTGPSVIPLAGAAKQATC